MINGFNFRNRVQGQKGFTLVEVIVVAIIVAALAAVAIPLYTSYVSSSRKNAAANSAGSIASFCGACRNTGGAGAIIDSSLTTGGGAIICNAKSDTTRIQIPTDIKIGYTAPTATRPGNIRAEHTADQADTANFNF
ncbi:MAG: prepilin-type N-terminal cleavage/methylation domain-containing protein [Fibrobacteres bacterium]|jgi:prepilin-type N-terminal cleavage/methylation domain-containing protein|nr:prepilin-type N-terminal cleavage/methylation domain-containing protein [Fibrobacterota bacterium]